MTEVIQLGLFGHRENEGATRGTSGREKPQPISSPPLFTLTKNPHVNQFVLKHLAEEHLTEIAHAYEREPFDQPVRAGKNTNVYDAHSYHTKVPPQGIEPFIEHYTEPGHLVLDPFCGSGMTGLAAAKLGRKAILIDISPAATFIAYNFCTPVDSRLFLQAVETLIASVLPEAQWLYETRCRRCGAPATTTYTVWSHEVVCPHCENRFVFSAVALDAVGRLKKEVYCPHCNVVFKKGKARRLSLIPVGVGYKCSRGCKFPFLPQGYPPSQFDLDRLGQIESLGLPIDLWYPNDPLPQGYNTRQPMAQGLTSVDKLYFIRSLWVLARLWNQAVRVKDESLRLKLLFLLTSLYKRITKLSEYRFWGGSSNTANLYVPVISNEQNVIDVVRRKSKEIAKFCSDYRTVREGVVCVSTETATCLDAIPSDSIDYVFTDPPFGMNINYSEMNFLWEAWLRAFTDNKHEAIINKVQRKDALAYQVLMTRSLSEVFRVLKPGRWMTLVFHNSSKRVWEAISAAMLAAGFRVLRTNTFDKVHGTEKMFVAENAVGYDVVMNCVKPSQTAGTNRYRQPTEDQVLQFVMRHLQQLSFDAGDERDERKLYSKAIAYFLTQNCALGMDFSQFRSLLDIHLLGIGGYWYTRDQEGLARHLGGRKRPWAGRNRS